jgi:hypothetical protein
VLPPPRGEQPEAAQHDGSAQVVTRSLELAETGFELRARSVVFALNECDSAREIQQVGAERLPVSHLDTTPGRARLLEQRSRLSQPLLAGAFSPVTLQASPDRSGRHPGRSGGSPVMFPAH